MSEQWGHPVSATTVCIGIWSHASEDAFLILTKSLSVLASHKAWCCSPHFSTACSKTMYKLPFPWLVQDVSDFGYCLQKQCCIWVNTSGAISQFPIVQVLTWLASGKPLVLGYNVKCNQKCIFYHHLHKLLKTGEVVFFIFSWPIPHNSGGDIFC